MALLLLACVLAAFFSLNIGSFTFSTHDILAILTGKNHENANILLQIRLPRVCIALICGALLALGGLLMQALVRNPLADPYIMGVTSGAGLGVNFLLCGIISVSHFSVYTLPFAAWIGALLSLLAVFVLGYSPAQEGNDKFLLAGVATSSLCMALTGFVIYRFAADSHIRKMIFWTLGSFDAISWQAVGISLGLLLLLIGFSYIFASRLDILQLGEVQAQTLGMNVIKQKMILLLVISASVGGLIAFTGPIGFVGMMIPHIVRAVWGSLHKKLILPIVFTGAFYLCICDALARLLLPPAGMPIGIITALLGVPFFMYLLYNKK